MLQPGELDFSASPRLNASCSSPLAVVEPCLRELIKLFDYSKTFGSLIRVPPDVAAQLPTARQNIGAFLNQ